MKVVVSGLGRVQALELQALPPRRTTKLTLDLLANAQQDPSDQELLKVIEDTIRVN